MWIIGKTKRQKQIKYSDSNPKYSIFEKKDSIPTLLHSNSMNKNPYINKSIFFFFLFGILLYNFQLVGQTSSDKIIVGVPPFTSSDLCCDKPEYKDRIEEAVVNVINNSKRFHLLERSQVNTLFNEEVLSKGESFINEFALEQGKKIAAKYLIIGKVLSAKIVTSETTNSEGKKKTFLEPHLELSIRLVDVETGLIKEAALIKPGNTFFGSLSTGFGALNEADCFNDALSTIKKEVEKELIRKIPISYKILAIEESNPDGTPKTVKVYAGKSSGVQKGDHLRIVENIPYEIEPGKVVINEKEIGKLTLAKVEDDNFSIWTVERKIATVLKQKLESKANLKAITVD